MELLHIHKDTWAAVGATALIPFYRLTDTDIVLLDTGIAASDREGLTALLEEHGLRPKGILCSHAHYDHVGNAAYLRRRYGCPIAMPMIEAAICADATAFRANYETLTYGTIWTFAASVSACCPCRATLPGRWALSPPTALPIWQTACWGRSSCSASSCPPSCTLPVI